MWDKAIFGYLRNETNRQNSGQDVDKISIQELCRFFGQEIIFMVYGLSEIHDLWARGKYAFQYAGKEAGLPRSRWQWINSHMKFSAKTLQQKLLLLWQHHAIPSTLLTCDESRIPAKQKEEKLIEFNPKKPARWALQSYTLTTQERYLFDFTLPKEMTGFDALQHLASNIQNTAHQHHITADTHFSNGDQAAKLLDKGVLCTLCCQETSKPTGLFKNGLCEGLPQWKSRFAKKEKLVAATLFRKKKINLITTWFELLSATKSGAAERRVLIDHYDATKRSTDNFNQLVSAYHNWHRHADVKNNLLAGWFEYAITNAYILYKNTVNKPLSHKRFLLAVSESLLLSPWK